MTLFPAPHTNASPGPDELYFLESIMRYDEIKIIHADQSMIPRINLNGL